MSYITTADILKSWVEDNFCDDIVSIHIQNHSYWTQFDIRISASSIMYVNIVRDNGDIYCSGRGEWKKLNICSRYFFDEFKKVIEDRILEISLNTYQEKEDE